MYPKILVPLDGSATALLAAARPQLSAPGIAVQTTLLAAAANACPSSSPTRPLGKRPIWSSWARMAGAASSAC